MTISFLKNALLQASSQATAPAAPARPPGTGKTLSADVLASALEKDTYTTAREPVGFATGGATRFERSKPHVNVGSFDIAPAPSASATCQPSKARVDADPGAAAYAKAMASAKEAISQTLTPLAGPDVANLAGSIVAALGLRSPIVPRLEPAFDSDGRMRLDALHAFSADDLDASTRGDVERSSSNATVAALAMRGRGSLLWAADGIQAELQRRIHDLEVKIVAHKASDDPQVRSLAIHDAKFAADKRALLKDLEAITARIRANSATVQDLNRIGVTLSALFHERMPHEIEKMNQVLDLAPANSAFRDIQHSSSAGTITYGRDGADFARRIGGSDLASEEARKARANLAGEVIGQIPNGQSALVGMYSSTPSALSSTPLPASYLNLGKTSCGELYLFDSGQAPHYRTGQDAQEYLASQIGYQIANRRKTAHSETYDLIPKVAFLPQSRGSID